jgi:hypothetical protein
MKYNIFLDDVRMPEDCVSYMRDPRYTSLNWIIVRDFEDFVHQIKSLIDSGLEIDHISFDHDLADEHYDPAMYQGVEVYGDLKFTAKTGKDCADWFVQFCIDRELPLPTCLIHSMNPAGRVRIAQSLEDYTRYKNRFNHE